MDWLRAQLDEDWQRDSHRYSDFVLAEIETKRRILDAHAGEHECPSEDDNCGWWVVACPTVQLLALPYADREGYDEKWRP